MYRGVTRSLAVFTWALTPAIALAARPFITDDARTVPARSLQVESWFKLDRTQFQFWTLLGLGAVGPLEVTIGGVGGANLSGSDAQFAIAGPLAQAKVSLREPTPNSWPGFAVAAGFVPPVGTGGFEPAGWDMYAYVALTEALFDAERLLIHGNVGAFFTSVGRASGRAAVTWGVAAQLRTVGDFHLLGEIISGDPYAENSGGAIHGGFRYAVNEYVQVDATVGGGVWGDARSPVWVTIGLRWVSAPLWGAR